MAGCQFTKEISVLGEMLGPVALEKYFRLLRVLIVLTDDCDHTGVEGAVETQLEDQDEPREEAGGAGDEGQASPLGQDHLLFPQVEQHHKHLDGEEDEDGDGDNDEVLVVEDVVVVLKFGPLYQAEGDCHPDQDDEVAGDVDEGEPLHQLVFNLWFPVEPTGQENVEETGQPD